jgi:S-adenosylmethionine decarboxylase
MGNHYLLNLYGCSSSLLDDELFIINLITKAANKCGASILHTASHKFTPQGVTAILLLSESHISIHTWPEVSNAAIDVYTCGIADPKVACDILIKELESTSHTMSYIER